MTAAQDWLALSEDERQARRDAIDADGWVLEDHQSALAQTAAILRRHDERMARESA